MGTAVVAAVVGPLTAAVLAALGVWLRELRQRRNRDQAYHRAIEQAHEQVSFVEGWLHTHQQLAPSELHEQARQRALDDLDRAYTLVNEAVVSVQRNVQPLTARRILAGLFLVDAVHTRPARMMRVLYYAALAWLFLWASLAVFALVTPTDSSASLLAGIGTSIGLFVFFLAMGGAPVLLMYALVMAVNRRPVDNSSYGATLNGESA